MHVLPTFVFYRARDIELEAGFILAGRLLVDLTKQEVMEDQQWIAGIIKRLTNDARSGQLPLDAIAYGWPGKPPSNAKKIENDDALMAAWAQQCTVIDVRVDPRNDGLMLDSGVLKQLGN